jgi:RHS repeat-associated protein
MFQGRRYDGEIELHYYRNRYYNSRLGRFVSRDPEGIWYDVSNFGNGYISFSSNSINRFDTYGLIDWSQVAEGTGWAIAGGAEFVAGVSIATAGSWTVAGGLLGAGVTADASWRFSTGLADITEGFADPNSGNNIEDIPHGVPDALIGETGQEGAEHSGYGPEVQEEARDVGEQVGGLLVPTSGPRWLTELLDLWGYYGLSRESHELGEEVGEEMEEERDYKPESGDYCPVPSSFNSTKAKESTERDTDGSADDGFVPIPILPGY